MSGGGQLKEARGFTTLSLRGLARAAGEYFLACLAHNLGKQVCAEGVEDPVTLKCLEEMGCDLAQGYFISRPVPAAALMTWLTDNFWGLKK